MSLREVPVLVTGADGFIGSHLVERLVTGAGPDHLSVLQAHRDLLPLPAQGEQPGLPLVADELEDIGQVEVFEGSFESH